MPGYDNQRRFTEFIDDLNRNPPILIMAEIESPFNIPYFGLEEDELCHDCTPEIRQGLLDLKHFVDEHYIQVDTIKDWQIYQRGK